MMPNMSIVDVIGLLNQDNQSVPGILGLLGAEGLSGDSDAPLPLAGKYNIFFNMSATFGMPTHFSVVTQGILRQAAQNPKASISAKVAQFPWTSGEAALFNAFTGVFTAIVVALAVAFIPAAYVVFVVKEREINAKHLQMISGVNIQAYWLSNYLFDYISFCVAGTFCVFMIWAFNNPAYTGENLPVVIVSMLLYGFCVIPFSYLFSFLFETASTAQNIMILVYLVTGVLFTILSFVFFTLEQTQEYAEDIRFIFRIFPNFCLSDGVFYLSILQLRKQFQLSNTQTGWDLDITGWNLIFMAIEGVVCFIAVLVIEHIKEKRASNGKVSENHKLYSKGLDKVEDEDVEAEKKRINDGKCSEDLITLKGLRKVFPQKVAVNDLYFSIPSNQCFGFLGVNGAGKSTTMKMLTGDYGPSGGDATLGSHSILTEQKETRRIVGYCPQFDAVHALMTGEETLAFYGRLRGIPEHKLGKMIEHLAECLTLDQDNQHKRPAGGYSGGNKRKLSVGIALIGNPSVVFLDEPSTGMDPVSRRFMWDFITQTMTERAVILTTHSMEECEALCSNIGILVHGRMRCIGSAQHLKSRFGNGFEFLLTISDLSRLEEVREFIQSSFDGVKEVEVYGGNMKYQLGKQDKKLSEIFALLESRKEDLGITEYSIGQSTLEQIFINFAAEGDRELMEEQVDKADAAKWKQMSSRNILQIEEEEAHGLLKEEDSARESPLEEEKEEAKEAGLSLVASMKNKEEEEKKEDERISLAGNPISNTSNNEKNDDKTKDKESERASLTGTSIPVTSGEEEKKEGEKDSLTENPSV